MKFRMLTLESSKLKIAVNIDRVRYVLENGDGSILCLDGKEDLEVCESYDICLSRLNIIAE